MALSSVFYNGVETVFKVFSESVSKGAVKTAIYTWNHDNGFGEVVTGSVSCRIIPVQFSQNDYFTTSFGGQIQPSDVKGLVPGNDLTSQNVTPSNGDHIAFEGTTYTVVAFDTDPYKALYVFLLRKI